MIGRRFLLVVMVLCGLWLVARQETARPFEPSIGRRLLGPISEVAAGWQWVRVRVALDDGQSDLAYARAELALDLAPQATDGWVFLASNLAFDRASPYRQPQPVLRTRWTQVALEVLERGQEVAREPAHLALMRGLILVNVGDSGGQIPWSGGVAGAWRDAQRAFEVACELDPGSSEAWSQRAANLCFRLGSEEVTRTAEERQEAARQALDLLEVGQDLVRQPANLVLQLGILLLSLAQGPDADGWPGGKEALLEEAIEAFARAAEMGSKVAAALLTEAEALRAELDSH